MSFFTVFSIHPTPQQRANGQCRYVFGAEQMVLEPDIVYVHTAQIVNKMAAMPVKVKSYGDLANHRRMLWSLRRASGDVTILATGGIGDWICLEPTLRALKAEGIIPRIIGYSPRQAILDNSPDGWRFKSLPVPLSDLTAACWHTPGIPYGWDDHCVPMPFIMAELAGVDLPAGDRPHIYPRRADLDKWERITGDVKRPLIGLQIAAAIPKRSYPPAMLPLLARELAHLGRVVLLGTMEQYLATVQPYLYWYPRVISACGMCYDPLDLAALIAQLNLLVTPDTGALHIAGALPDPVPTVGMTAIYPASYAGGTHPRYYAVTADEWCSPCNQHSHDNCHLVNELNIPRCWATITPRKVASAASRALADSKPPVIPKIQGKPKTLHPRRK